MKGIYSDCVEKLKKDDLYDCFVWIAQATCKKNTELNWLITVPIPMDEAIDILKRHKPMIGRELLKRDIQSLIYSGLLKYSNHNIDYIDNFERESSLVSRSKYHQSLYEFQNSVTDDIMIEITQKAEISGWELYNEILNDMEEKKIVSGFEESFNAAVDENVQKYQLYVEETKSKLEKRLEEIENGTIKSIEVISVFVAVMSLLVINMGSISTLAERGVCTILLVNVSTVVCIFFLLLFIKIIICGKNFWQDILKSIVIMTILIIISLFLIFR